MKRYVRSSEIPDSETILQEITNWAQNWRTVKFKKFEKYGLYLEKHSLQSMYNNCIKYFNRNISEYGNGFAADWDPDDYMIILYRDGSIREVNDQWDEGTQKIKTDGIDSIILDGSWGTAFAGPHIAFEDYTTYEDIPDIRVTFSI